MLILHLDHHRNRNTNHCLYHLLDNLASRPRIYHPTFDRPKATRKELAFKMADAPAKSGAAATAAGATNEKKDKTQKRPRDDAGEDANTAADPAPKKRKKNQKSKAQRKAMKKAREAAAAGDADAQTESPETQTAPDDKEQQRRAHQRNLQQIVVRMRKEGKSPEEISEVTWKVKKEFQAVNLKDERREYWKAKKAENEAKKRAILSGEAPASGSAADTDTAASVQDGEGGEAASGPSEGTKAAAPSSTTAPAVSAKTAARAARADPDGEEHEETAEQEAEEAAALACPHDVIIIPVIFRGRKDKLQLMEAAEQCKRILMQQGVDTWIDSRRQYTPGQKFAFWEHKGTKFRIEIGPRDFAEGKICLCKHPDTPGDYLKTVKSYCGIPAAQGSSIGGSGDAAREMLLQFQEWGLAKLEGCIVGRAGEGATAAPSAGSGGKPGSASSVSSAAAAAVPAATSTSNSVDALEGNTCASTVGAGAQKVKKEKKHGKKDRKGRA